MYCLSLLSCNFLTWCKVSTIQVPSFKVLSVSSLRRRGVFCVSLFISRFIFYIFGRSSWKMFLIFIFTSEFSSNFPHNSLKRRISSEDKVQATSSAGNHILRETFVKYIFLKSSHFRKTNFRLFSTGTKPFSSVLRNSHSEYFQTIIIETSQRSVTLVKF